MTVYSCTIQYNTEHFW